MQRSSLTLVLSYFIAFVQALHSPTSHETFHQRNYFYVGGHYINITEALLFPISGHYR